EKRSGGLANRLGGDSGRAYGEKTGDDIAIGRDALERLGQSTALGVFRHALEEVRSIALRLLRERFKAILRDADEQHRACQIDKPIVSPVSFRRFHMIPP